MVDSAKKTVEEETKQDEELDDVSEKLVDSVQAKLDSIMGDSSDTEEDADEDTDDDKQADDNKDDDDSTPGDDDDQADESDDDDDSTPEKDKDETGDKDDSKDDSKDESGSEKEVALPDAYYRAAIHQGWKPEEIKEFFEANPELAIKTLAKNHEATNKISSEFARLGRVELSKGSEAKTVTEATKAKAADGEIDLAALKEQYGGDSAVVKAFTVMQTKLDTAREAFPDKQEQQEELDPAVVIRIQKFFVDPTLKPYADFYGEGKDEGKLTRDQSDNRYKVLETADSIVLGCQKQGREITLEEALESAHLLVSESVREKALRIELTAKVVKRAKGVSLRPSKSKKVLPAKSAELDEKAMEAKVSIGLKNTFG